MTISGAGSLAQPSQKRRGPPLGRHAAAVGLTVALMLVFARLESPERSGLGFDPISNATPADASLVLLCLILMLGAGSRLVPRLRRVAPWRRELGIAMFVTAVLHVAILNDLSLDVTHFFGESTSRGFVFGTRMFAAANWVGLLALGYALVLAATSNDWSQRQLRRGWKFLHQQTYTLFVLVWLHTAAFVVLGAGHGAVLPIWLFWIVSMGAVAAQSAGFVRTVWAPRKPSARRGPPTRVVADSGVVWMPAARWAVVLTLWGALMVGTWLTTETYIEGRQVARLCDRYAELRDTPLEEIRDELGELAPSGGPLGEWLELCDGG